MLLLSWIAALVVISFQDPTLPPTISPEEECAAALVQLVDAPTREARRSLAASLARKHANEPQLWSTAMANFGRFEPQKAGVRIEPVDLDVLGKRERTELWVYVPAKYDPAKPAPLMLAFHGTGGSGQGMHQMWQKCADELCMLVLAPSEAGDNSGYHFADRERAAALAALRWMRRHHNVDENRIYASGISRGGHLTWDLALRYPDQFAAIAAFIGSPRLTLVAGQNNMRLLENIATLPLRDLQGAKDDAGLVYSVRLAFDLLGRFAPRDAKLIEFPERGHDFDFSAVDWPTWLAASVRDPWPARVVRCTATKDEGRAAWLEITGFSKEVDEVFQPKVQQGEWSRMSEDAQRRFFVSEAVKRNARVVANRTGPGSFALEFDEATKARLYLRAEDLVEKAGVKISLGGKQLVRQARAEVKTMLEDFAERFDRTFIVSAHVDVP